MTRLIVKSKVGADGVLHLEVPVGTADANLEARVTIETLHKPPADMNLKEYSDWLASTVGSWQGPFERPEQVEYEKREAF